MPSSSQNHKFLPKGMPGFILGGTDIQPKKKLYLDIFITSQLTHIKQVLVAISFLLDLIKIMQI